MRPWIYSLAFLIVATVTMIFGPGGASADDGFQRIEGKAEFMSTIAGRSLTRLGIRLDVDSAGGITGRAFGMNVAGDWQFENGYFCRTLNYGTETLPRNCQVVKVSGDTVRFIADKGAGDTADLRIR